MATADTWDGMAPNLGNQCLVHPDCSRSQLAYQSSCVVGVVFLAPPVPPSAGQRDPRPINRDANKASQRDVNQTSGLCSLSMYSHMPHSSIPDRCSVTKVYFCPHEADRRGHPKSLPPRGHGTALFFNRSRHFLGAMRPGFARQDTLPTTHSYGATNNSGMQSSHWLAKFAK